MYLTNKRASAYDYSLVVDYDATATTLLYGGEGRGVEANKERVWNGWTRDKQHCMSHHCHLLFDIHSNRYILFHYITIYYYLIIHYSALS